MKYIGSTSQPLNKRLSTHKSDKRAGRKYYSSSKLHLEHSIIYELERCHEDKRKEREGYWINEIECVNERKLTYVKKEYMRDYNQRNKDKNREYMRDYRAICRICKFLKILDEY